MRKIIIFIILSASINVFGQKWRESPVIDDVVIMRLNNLYLSEKYEECIDSCQYYMGHLGFTLGYDKHPYQEWSNKKYIYDYDIEKVANVIYLGCVSAYQYSLTHSDTRLCLDAAGWSRACAAIFNDYINVVKPNELWTEEKLYKYILYGESGIIASRYGQHFLKIAPDERWCKKQTKWFDKMIDSILDALSKRILENEELFSKNPLLQYKSYSILSTQNFLNKQDFKSTTTFYNKRFDALSQLIQNSNQNNYSFEVHEAVSSLSKFLSSTVTISQLCKKLGNNYEGFCMENLIKLQDLCYFLNGSNKYSQYSNYSLKDIQNCLEETDCAILHFEAPVAAGHLYSTFDLGTRYRNYALIITKNQEVPDVWHRGFISDNKVNDLNLIKETYPKAKRFFFVGTPRMAFIDIAGKDSSIVRLHSLSQLLKERKKVLPEEEITFIGALNYRKINIRQNASINKGGESISNNKKEYEPLIGSSHELKFIKSLFKNVRPIIGNEASKNVVASEISRSKGIVHISTHGDIINSDDYIKPEDLILKKNIMDNSLLILSGYNDAPNSSSTYMSGSDILKIKKLDSSVVFLDACLSGQGAVGASGCVGIAEAFHLIGSQYVICYLESIQDDIATEFSNNFYKELSNGLSVHSAFFSAKNSIKNDIKVVLWE